MKKVRDDRFIIESLFLGDECRAVPRPRRARSKLSAPVNLQNSLIKLMQEEDIEWKIFLNNKTYLLLLMPLAQPEAFELGQCSLAKRVEENHRWWLWLVKIFLHLTRSSHTSEAGKSIFFFFFHFFLPLLVDEIKKKICIFLGLFFAYKDVTRNKKKYKDITRC